LLHQFPFEANVAARFDVLDETKQTQLLERLTLDVLLAGARAPDSPIGLALDIALTAASDNSFREAVRTAIAAREAVARWVIEADGIEPAIAAMSRQLDLNPTETRDSIEDEFFSRSLIPTADWPTVAAALEQGTKTDIEQARRFKRLASLSASDRVSVYLDIFCTAEERTARKSIVTQAIKDADLTQRLTAEQSRVCALLDRWRAAICRDRSAALLTIVHEVLQRYEGEKKRRGLVDYDDLIDKMLELLRNVDAAWVHYKLDFVFREFKHSCRSGANILAAVDAVFSDKAIAASVSSDADGFPPHIALPDTPAGLVEIWDPVEPEKNAEIDGWDAPFDQVSETSARVRLARRIARTVRRLVEAGEPVGIDGRAMRYGDVLVLVRQRGELFESIIR